jgi:hypothetical protein
MTDDSPPQATMPPTRWKVVGGSVTAEEFGEVEAAWQRAGYKNRSAFVRETVLERARHINADKRAADRAA